MVENHKIVFTKPCPIKLIEESNKKDKKGYKAWIRSDKIMRAISWHR